jgi:hypothetical protein
VALCRPAIIDEEAGGRFTDFAGAARIDAGHAAVSNGILHGEVFSALTHGVPAS